MLTAANVGSRRCRTVSLLVGSTSIIPRRRFWQSGGMKWGMWKTPSFTFSRRFLRLSSSNGSAPCRQGTANSTAVTQFLGSIFIDVNRLTNKDGWLLTTNRANRMTPQLHASAFLPSYFSPWTDGQISQSESFSEK